MDEPISIRWWLLRIALGVIGFYVSLGLILGYVIDDRPLTRMRIARLERELAAHLPIGSTEADARAWYAARGMEPSPLARIPDLKITGLGGSLQTANILGFHEAQILVYVHFGDDGRVERWSVSRKGHSL